MAGNRISVDEKKGLAAVWPGKVICLSPVKDQHPSRTVLRVRWTRQGCVLPLMLVLPLGKGRAKGYSKGHLSRPGEARLDQGWGRGLSLDPKSSELAWSSPSLT